MRLYHGTAENIATIVRTTGLLPRRRHTGTANWQHVFTGNADAIYLTDAYPVIYAVEAVENVMAITKTPERLAIIEIDSEQLAPGKFVPDEDMLEQVGRGRDTLPRSWSPVKRSTYYRSRLHEHAELWAESLTVLGTCGYMDAIPVHAMSRLALIDYQRNPHAVLMAMDAAVTLINYRWVGDQHRTLTNWFFGDPLPMTDNPLAAHAYQVIRRLPRDGIEVIDLKSS